MTNTPEEIIEAHQKAYPSSSDEAWDTNAICGTCNHLWPCDTAVLGELLTEVADNWHDYWNTSATNAITDKLRPLRSKANR